jgi:hypothetical protein
MTVAEFERERMECEIYDFAYSIAVVQHCTDAVFRSILHDVRARMRPRRKIAFHLVIDGSGWRSEQENFQGTDEIALWAQLLYPQP